MGKFNMLDIFRKGARHSEAKIPKHNSGDANAYRYRDVDTYLPRTTVVSSIIDYIANDIAIQTFTHEKVDVKTGVRTPKLGSPIYEVLNMSLKDGKTSTEFWTEAIKHMLQTGWVYIEPIYEDGVYSANGLIDLKILDDRPDDLTTVMAIKSPYTQGHQAKMLMDKLYEIMWKDMRADDAKGYLKVNAMLDEESDDFNNSTISVLNTFYQYVEDYGIGIIDGKSTYHELNRDYRRITADDIKLIEKQVYAVFGVTENVILGNATQEQMKLYKQTVIEPINKQLVTEMERVLLSKYLRVATEEKPTVDKIDIYVDRYQYESLNRIADTIKAMTNAGAATRNELRSLIGLNPIIGGEDIVTNLNNVQLTPEDTTQNSEDDDNETY